MMRPLRILVWLLAAATPVGAQELYIPAAAHSPGAAGTVWRTDLEVMAGGGEAASFTVELLEQRHNNSSPLSAAFSLAAGESLRLGDVVGEVFGFEGSGALRLTATEGSVLATSRTYNDSAAGTFGQFIPACEADAAAEPESGYVLLQLAESASYRTNVGFVNATGGELDLEVELHAASADLLGAVQATLRPYEMRQISNIFAEVTAQEVEDGYAVVRTVTDGGRFFAYASVVDNLSGDAVFIPAQLDRRAAVEPQSRVVVFEAFMRPG